MNPITKNVAATLMFCLPLFLVSNVRAQSVGQWDFNSSNLVQTAGGTLGDLQYADVLTSSQTAFGTTTSFGLPNIGGSPAVIMRFPAATNGMGYNMPTPPNAN